MSLATAVQSSGADFSSSTPAPPAPGRSNLMKRMRWPSLVSGASNAFSALFVRLVSAGFSAVSSFSRKSCSFCAVATLISAVRQAPPPAARPAITARAIDVLPMRRGPRSSRSWSSIKQLLEALDIVGATEEVVTFDRRAGDVAHATLPNDQTQ
jgi:hypothetical protein